MVPWWWYTYRCRSNGRQVAEVIVGTNQAHFRSCVALRSIIHVEAWERLNRFGGHSKEASRRGWSSSTLPIWSETLTSLSRALLNSDSGRATATATATRSGQVTWDEA